jgi:hypothetical protein
MVHYSLRFSLLYYFTGDEGCLTAHTPAGRRASSFHLDFRLPGVTATGYTFLSLL